jgi:predicted enzyme related to lactoylglutathione lyase
MPQMTAHRPGTFSWVDLAAHDVDAAERFYTQLFGWTADRTQFGPDADDVYVTLRKDGHDAAALYAMDPTQKAQGMPPAWLSYVTVESADEAASRARVLGATVLADAFDVMDVGRMALIGDPEGAMFAAWEPGKHIGAGIMNEPGALCWNDLATRDLEGASQFYAALFGWTPQPRTGTPRPYTTLMNGDAPAGGGIYAMPPEMAGTPPHWAPYFAVEDADASVRRAGELGAKVGMAPHDLPGVGRFAMLRDPQGAEFYVIRLARTGS